MGPYKLIKVKRFLEANNPSQCDGEMMKAQSIAGTSRVKTQRRARLLWPVMLLILHLWHWTIRIKNGRYQQSGLKSVIDQLSQLK